MLRLTRTFFTVFLALASAWVMAIAIEASDNRKVTLEHYTWSGNTPKAKVIRVINPFGSITTRNTTHNNVEMSGVIQKIGVLPGQHQIDITDNNGVTEVIVSYPHGNKNSLGQLTGRFDLGVWVPSWVTVEMVTDFGDIKVKKHASNIVATTISGKMTIGTAGLVNANSDSGNIKVDLYGERFKQPMRLSSTKGNVYVNFSQSAALNLLALSGRPIKNNLNDVTAINVSEFNDTQFKAQLTQSGQKSTDLHVSAKYGKLSINIAKKVSYRIKSTPRLFLSHAFGVQTQSNIKTKTVSLAEQSAAKRVVTGEKAAF